MKKQAIFPVLMLLVVTALALMGSTFAWFSVSNTAKVSNIQANAQSSDVDLKLSYDGQTYYTGTLNLPTSADGLVLPDTLYQVSTDGTYTGGLLNMYHAAFDHTDILTGKDYIKTYADSTLKSTSGILSKDQDGIDTIEDNTMAADATDCLYIAFDLYISVAKDADLYLYSGSDATGQVANAIRVAFMDLGSVAVTTTPANDIAAVKALDSCTSAKIWQPVGSDTTYGVKATQSTAFEAGASNANTADQNALVSSVLVVGTDKDLTGKTSIISLTAGYNKVRIIVWLEGQDPQCVAAVASTQLTLSLSFYAKATA